MVGEPSAQYTQYEVKFGGVLGTLDAADRVKPVEDIDIGRMRWARGVFDEPQRFSMVFWGMGRTLWCVRIFAAWTRGTQQCSDG